MSDKSQMAVAAFLTICFIFFLYNITKKKPQMDNSKKLDENYWQNRYHTNETQWDTAGITTPLQAYIDQLPCQDIRVLVPGAGNGYEAEYLFNKGFDVTVIDMARTPLQNLKSRCPAFPDDKLVHGDFFDHEGRYNLILEQTFFCALPPALRPQYALKMHELLLPDGILAGVLFDLPAHKAGPPFGGTLSEYKSCFAALFEFKHFERCYNSIKPRAGKEFFIELERV